MTASIYQARYRAGCGKPLADVVEEIELLLLGIVPSSEKVAHSTPLKPSRCRQTVRRGQVCLTASTYPGTHQPRPLLTHAMRSVVRDNVRQLAVSPSYVSERSATYPQNVPYFVVEIALFFLYSILTGLAVNIFIHRPKRTRFRQWTLHLCAFMYLLSATHLCMSIMCFIYSRSGTLWVGYLPGQILVPVNVAISDAIVIWRAWVLWPCNRWVQGSLGLCVLGDIAGLVMIGGRFRESAGLPGAAASLGTNICTTVLISCKAWRHHKDIGIHLGVHVGRTKIEKTLLLFIESGLVYALLWSFIVSVLLLLLYKDTSPVIGDISYGMLQYPTIQLVSIYPMATVVLMDYSNSYFGRALAAETTHRRGPATDGTETPQLETTIDACDVDGPLVTSHVLSGVHYVTRQQRIRSNDELALTSAFMTQTSA